MLTPAKQKSSGNCSDVTTNQNTTTPTNEKINLLNFTRQQLREFFISLGEKPFRADQVMKWIYHFGIDDFDLMTDINKKLREQLKTLAEIKAPKIAIEQRSSDGTIKWALDVGNNQMIESVYIPERDRATLCVSHRLVVHWNVNSVQLLNKVLIAI